MPLSKTLNKIQLTVLKLCVFLQSTHIIFNILTTKQQTANAKLSEFLQSPLPPNSVSPNPLTQLALLSKHHRCLIPSSLYVIPLPLLGVIL